MIIIDDFIQNKTLLDNIAKDKTFFNNNGQYYWYDGWWEQEPNTLKKELIKELWGENSPYKGVKIEGFEYWTGQLGPDANTKELPIHFDKDEAEWERSGKVIPPIIGTVFYPVPLDITGGDLAIYSSGIDNEPEIVKPRFNRLVIFDAGNHQHTVQPVNSGLRSAIAINLWDRKLDLLME